MYMEEIYMENVENNEEVTIDLMAIFNLLKKNIAAIIAVAVLFGACTAAVTIFAIPYQYESVARVFPKPETQSGNVDATTANANSTMVNNYVAMVEGSTICDKVDNNLGLEKDFTSKHMTVEAGSDTQIITITVKTEDAQLSKKIVDNVVSLFYSELRAKLGVTNVTTIDAAKVATKPASPSIPKNTVIGAFVGLVVSIVVLVIRYLLDTRIKSKEEAESFFDLPVMGVIPSIEYKDK